ncbi:MAG: CTP synthase [Planctomycetes bacterium]|nr:CTP synthase [Planctomycetota bacterium]
MAKFIFVTGGVVSSLGKGITSASIGALLKSRGIRVKLQKFDPYLNVDPGTMNPYQHGEVYVTEDGAETDLDLGHYERFTGDYTSRASNATAGSVYYEVLMKERRGDYLGKTIQMVPHITDEIKRRVRKLDTPEVDVVICEVGGTVGDIESLIFLEAIRQIGQEEGRNNVLYIHLTLVPYIRAAGEIKTKPTQHSVGKLREIGIIPDVLICRSELPLSKEIRDKISLFCNVQAHAVIEEIDVKHTIYEVPFVFAEQGLDTLICNQLGLRGAGRDLTKWRKVVSVLTRAETTVPIAVVGKYSELQDAYKSIYEAIMHGGVANECKVDIRKVLSEDIEEKGAATVLAGVKGILVPGGFGTRGVQGKILAIQYAREKGVPFFGICLGLQCAVIEFARNACGLPKANTTEIDPDTSDPVICLLEEQKVVVDKGATMRLGAYPCHLQPNTKALDAYGEAEISERHRHRYEFNNKYREAMSAKGMVFSGLSPDGELVEIIELADLPWFVATQFHPEFKSRPVDAHPLFRDFVKAALNRKDE